MRKTICFVISFVAMANLVAMAAMASEGLLWKSAHRSTELVKDEEWIKAQLAETTSTEDTTDVPTDAPTDPPTDPPVEDIEDPEDQDGQEPMGAEEGADPPKIPDGSDELAEDTMEELADMDPEDPPEVVETVEDMSTPDDPIATEDEANPIDETKQNVETGEENSDEHK